MVDIMRELCYVFSTANTLWSKIVSATKLELKSDISLHGDQFEVTVYTQDIRGDTHA